MKCVLFFVFIIQLLSSSESSEPRSAICYSMSAFYYLNLCNLISYMFLKNTICKENRKFFQLTISLEGRLELSDFFSQWTRGKMKIRLEKPAVNISNLTGSKNEKARRGALHEKLRLDLFVFFLQGAMNGNQNNWICDISTRGFLIEILWYIYNAQQTK